MREKFVNFFKRDSTLKVISVVAAIIIWFIILSDNNPEVIITKTISHQFKKEDISANSGNDILKNVDDLSVPITIKISGRTQSVSNTTDNDFNVDFDFSSVSKSGIVEIPVKVTTNKVGIVVDSYSPKVVKMKFEKIIDKSLNVKVEVDKNVLKDGYEVYETKIVPESIPIEGFESIVNKVSTVKVLVSLSDVNDETIDRNKTVRKICKYYDKNGKELNDFEKNSVDVTIVVGKKVPIKHQITGEPREGFYVEESSINPSYALITGEPSIINNIKSLSTETVDISNANNDIKRNVRINIPSGVSLLNSSLQPEVTVNIEAYEKKTINIKNTDISLTGGNTGLYNYVIKTGTFSYQLTGKKSDVLNINVESLKPQIEVKNLGTGSYTIPIKITVPNDVSFSGSYSATVIISDKSETHDPISTTPGPDVTSSAGSETNNPGNTSEPENNIH